MGQYYVGMVLKKNHRLAKQPILFGVRSYDFDNGSKLLEHSYIGNNYVSVYMRMLSDVDGYFYGYPFAWIGDYADKIRNKDYFRIFCDNPKISKESHELINTSQNKYYKYLVNFNKKQYVKLPRYDEKIWQMHPLPLLTAFGNGRGGGDYVGLPDEKKVGIWAFDRIGVTNYKKEIKGFQELEVNFKSDF